MRLLLDIGNTRLKWLITADATKLPPAQAHAHGGDAAGALSAIAGAMAGQRIESIWIAHVMGAGLEPSISAACQAHWTLIPQFARSQAELAGLRMGYAAPERLGVDRFLAMLALWQARHGAFNVASAGTALTFDAVDASGQHRGGVIAPGVQAMISATLANTRFATGSPDAARNSGLGANTEDCVQLGALHACAGMLERLARQHASSRNRLSGGNAESLIGLLDEGHWQVQHDLVLAGLAHYAALRA